MGDDWESHHQSDESFWWSEFWRKSWVCRLYSNFSRAYYCLSKASFTYPFVEPQKDLPWSPNINIDDVNKTHMTCCCRNRMISKTWTKHQPFTKPIKITWHIAETKQYPILRPTSALTFINFWTRILSIQDNQNLCHLPDTRHLEMQSPTFSVPLNSSVSNKFLWLITL